MDRGLAQWLAWLWRKLMMPGRRTWIPRSWQSLCMTIRVWSLRGSWPDGTFRGNYSCGFSTFARSMPPPTANGLFPAPTGAKLTNVSRKLKALADQCNISLPTPTNVRKSIITKSSKRSDSDRSALASTMSYSKGTVDRYYKAHLEATSKQGFNVIGEIMEVEQVPVLKKRVRFRNLQTSVLTEYFAENIESGKLPLPAALEQFLAEKRDLFPLRKRGDIYSKLRNIIGRKNIK